MGKAELMDIAARYGMDFIRDAFTRDGAGVWLRTEDAVPELDALLKTDIAPCSGVCYRDSKGFIYHIFCPSDWIALTGWKE